MASPIAAKLAASRFSTPNSRRMLSATARRYPVWRVRSQAGRLLEQMLVRVDEHGFVNELVDRWQDHQGLRKESVDWAG